MMPVTCLQEILSLIHQVLNGSKTRGGRFLRRFNTTILGASRRTQMVSCLDPQEFEDPKIIFKNMRAGEIMFFETCGSSFDLMWQQQILLLEPCSRRGITNPQNGWIISWKTLLKWMIWGYYEFSIVLFL